VESVIQVLWLELNSVRSGGSNCRNFPSLHTTGRQIYKTCLKATEDDRQCPE